MSMIRSCSCVALDMRVGGCCVTYFIPNTPTQIPNTLPNIRRVIISLVRILARRSQQLLMRSFQRIDSDFKLDVIVRQLGFGFRVACLLFKPLLTTCGEGRHGAGDAAAESLEFVHAAGREGEFGG